MHFLAPAKINLYLHILGRRPDGYHRLDSLVAFTDVCDRITLSPSDQLTCLIQGSFAPGLKDEGDNIVLKAACALANWAGIAPQVHISLEKHIPIGAGLGGGSSDAAATLRLLVKWWKLDIGPQTLHDIALLLGADVPVMLGGRAAFMSGIGETLAPVGTPFAFPVLLVNPGVFVSTAEVYKKWQPLTSPFFPPAEGGVSLAAIRACRNDLETPAIALQPVIRDVLALLAAQKGCGLSRMSGSGATCFGVFDSLETAKEAAQVIKTLHPGWWVRQATAHS